MKIRNYLTAALCAVIVIACTEPEVFYSISYPIVKVEAEVKATPTTIPPETEGGEPTTGENPIVERITRIVLANAPVEAGGSYKLDFTQYNGGRVYVETATDAGSFVGGFFKTPGSDSLYFYVAQQEYTYKLESDAVNKVVLTSDLTKHFQALYPDDKITSVLRKEFTSVNAK